jgi:hypothetical protein
MKRSKFAIAAICLILGSVFGMHVVRNQIDGLTGGSDNSIAGGAWRQTRIHDHQFAPSAVNPYQYLLEFFANLPDGTNLDQAQFDQVLGADAAKLLRSLNVTHIEAKSGVVHVTLSQVYDTKTDSAEIRVDTSLTFSHKLDGSGTLICDNIVGLEVKASSLLGWMPVKHVEVSHDAAGNTTIEVEVSSPFGTIKRTVHLDPDGKPIP